MKVLSRAHAKQEARRLVRLDPVVVRRLAERIDEPALIEEALALSPGAGVRDALENRAAWLAQRGVASTLPPSPEGPPPYDGVRDRYLVKPKVCPRCAQTARTEHELEDRFGTRVCRHVKASGEERAVRHPRSRCRECAQDLRRRQPRRTWSYDRLEER